MQVACVVALASGKEGEVGAAFDTEAFGVESEVFELVEFEEAQEFFVWLEVEDVVFLLLDLESVLKNKL